MKQKVVLDVKLVKRIQDVNDNEGYYMFKHHKYGILLLVEKIESTGKNCFFWVGLGTLSNDGMPEYWGSAAAAVRGAIEQWSADVYCYNSMTDLQCDAFNLRRTR